MAVLSIALILAAVHTATVEASCFYNEYRCNNGYCIPDSERCDGYYDCGDNSDEWNCSSGRRASSLGLAVGVTVVLLCCIGICIAGCCCGGYSYNRKRPRMTRTAPAQPVATVTTVTTAVASQTTTSSHVADYSDKLQRAKAGYPPPYTPTVVSSPPWFQQASNPQQAWISHYPPGSYPPPPPPPQ